MKFKSRRLKDKWELSEPKEKVRGFARSQSDRQKKGGSVQREGANGY